MAHVSSQQVKVNKKKLVKLGFSRINACAKNRKYKESSFLQTCSITQSQFVVGNLVTISCLVVGQPTAVDIDGDAFTELFVPSYSVDLLYVFSYSPEK